MCVPHPRVRSSTTNGQIQQRKMAEDKENSLTEERVSGGGGEALNTHANTEWPLKLTFCRPGVLLFLHGSFFAVCTQQSSLLYLHLVDFDCLHVVLPDQST